MASLKSLNSPFLVICTVLSPNLAYCITSINPDCLEVIVVSLLMQRFPFWPTSYHSQDSACERFLHQLKTVCGTAQASSNCSEIPGSIGALLKSVTVSVRSKKMYRKPYPLFIAYSRVCSRIQLSAYAGRYFCHLDAS